MNMDKYSDIINLSHPTSKKHPPMSMEARAAQFSSFAALRGHKEGIEDVARLNEEEIEKLNHGDSIIDY